MTNLARGQAARRGGMALALAALALGMASPARAAQVQVSTGAHYSNGDYGGDRDVEMIYVPVEARLFLRDDWEFAVVVPWIEISGGSSVVEGPGGPITLAGGTNSGLGDIAVEGAWIFHPYLDAFPSVRTGMRVKLPTADEDQGLGTGKVDFTPEIEVYRERGRWTPLASLGFRILGDERTQTYRDGLLANVGALFRMSDAWDGGAFLYWRQAANKGSDDPLEILPMLRVALGQRWRVSAYASIGIGDSVPDAGGGLQVDFLFLPEE